MTDSLPPDLAARAGPPRAQLRAATQAQHTRLEALLRLGAPDLTAPEYTAVLRHFYPIYAHLEAALRLWDGAFAAQGVHLAARLKLPLLDADLRALGTLPQPQRVTLSLDSAAAAWGCLYVLEGATLGGQFIVRAVQALGFTPAYGAAFFAGYGASTGKNWRAFCEALDAALHNDPAAGAAAVQAACSTFELFAHGWHGAAVHP